MAGDANDEEKKTFYKALLKISWLPPTIRRAVMNELGLSLRAQKNDFNLGWLTAVRHLIAEEKARLKNARRLFFPVLETLLQSFHLQALPSCDLFHSSFMNGFSGYELQDFFSVLYSPCSGWQNNRVS
jgi:hypothetical protein